MTQQELNALIQLLNRMPLSQAEGLWLTELLMRLQQEIKAREQHDERTAG